jgi:3,4-dihydroxy 2-butanone 4-phosphate synthase/GTP cyclohydrolase II
MLGVGGQILADLGVSKLRVLGNPRRLYGVSGFGLEIVDYVTE